MNNIIIDNAEEDLPLLVLSPQFVVTSKRLPS